MNAALADSDKKEGTAAAVRPEICMDVVLLGGMAKPFSWAVLTALHVGVLGVSLFLQRCITPGCFYSNLGFSFVLPSSDEALEIFIVLP